MARRHIGQRERLAIFERAGGRCHICAEKIDGTRDAWDVEHVVARELGGTEAKMDENLQPAHRGRQCHGAKTADDRKRIAKAQSVAARHIGAEKPKSVIPGSKASGWKRRLDGSVVRRTE